DRPRGALSRSEVRRRLPPLQGRGSPLALTIPPLPPAGPSDKPAPASLPRASRRAVAAASPSRSTSAAKPACRASTPPATSPRPSCPPSPWHHRRARWRVSGHFSHACLVGAGGRDLFSPIVLQVEDGCRQFAIVTVRLFGGRTRRPGFKASSISVNIARLTGFRSRPSTIGA